MKMHPGIITGGHSTSGTGGSSGGSGGDIIPAFVAAGTAKHSIGSTTVPYPAGVLTDDILILLQETAGGDAAPAAPSGWTEITNSPSADTTGTSAQKTRISAFWKRYNSSTDFLEAILGVSSPDAGDHQNAIIVAFRNCYLLGNPWDVTAAGTAGLATTAVSCPTVTTTGTNRLVLAVASTSIETSSTTEFSGWTNANLTGITEIVDFTTTSGDGGGIGAAYGFKATAGATGATTATAVNNERHAYLTIALKGQTG
jgi:hypothetical protein